MFPCVQAHGYLPCSDKALGNVQARATTLERTYCSSLSSAYMAESRQKVTDSLQVQTPWEGWFQVLAPPGSQYDQ